MPTTLGQRPRRRFDKASGRWVEPFNFKAAIRTAINYIFVVLVLCIPILLSCIEIANASHTADPSMTNAIIHADEEDVCIDSDSDECDW
jgi:hypothetical protein